jgi:hypothetical protein
MTLPPTYCFNVADGTYDEVELVTMYGPKVTVRWRGIEWRVRRELVTKDPDEIKKLRMAWERSQARVNDG